MMEQVAYAFSQTRPGTEPGRIVASNASAYFVKFSCSYANLGALKLTSQYLQNQRTLHLLVCTLYRHKSTLQKLKPKCNPRMVDDS